MILTSSKNIGNTLISNTGNIFIKILVINKTKLKIEIKPQVV